MSKSETSTATAAPTSLDAIKGAAFGGSLIQTARPPFRILEFLLPGAPAEIGSTSRSATSMPRDAMTLPRETATRANGGLLFPTAPPERPPFGPPGAPGSPGLTFTRECLHKGRFQTLWGRLPSPAIAVDVDVCPTESLESLAHHFSNRRTRLKV